MGEVEKLMLTDLTLQSFVVHYAAYDVLVKAGKMFGSAWRGYLDACLTIVFAPSVP